MEAVDRNIINFDYQLSILGGFTMLVLDRHKTGCLQLIRLWQISIRSNSFYSYNINNLSLTFTALGILLNCDLTSQTPLEN